MASSTGPTIVTTNGLDGPAAVRPVLLLDVDGVINAGCPGWGGPPAIRTVIAQGVPWRIRWAPALVARLRSLAAAGTAEIRWATTWVDDIDALARELVLPRWPVAFTLGAHPRAAPAVKAGAALDVVHREGRPLVWIDDDALPAPGSDRHVALMAAPVPVMLVQPSTGRGLQPADLDAVERFCRGESAGSQPLPPSG